MEGGKIIGQGSQSCIFRPNIPCYNESDKVINEDKISKIMYGEKSKDKSEYELMISNKIKKIRGHKNWAIIFEKQCEPPIYDDIMKYEPDIEKCIYGSSETISSNSLDNNYMLVGNYGGVTLDDYFYSLFHKKVTGKKLETNFLDLMNKMKPLFTGVKALLKNNIIHNDIKYNNILLDKDKFKLIDFGLSGTLDNKAHFKKRSKREFNTSRIYIFYPLEYILFYANKKQLNDELKYIQNGQERHFTDDLKLISYIFGYDYYETWETIIERINNKLVDEEEMIKSIDVYSLGIIIPILFIHNNVNSPFPYEKSEMIADFYQIFGLMIYPYSGRWREKSEGKNMLAPSFDTICRKFNALLKKYNNKDSKSQRKSNKKTEKEKEKKKSVKRVRRVKRRV
tara:strand:+ start:466 stop:1653 length:1188 start_codon:yes stop_codon:yes gene_type:complete